MKTQPRLHICNKYNTCTVVTGPVYIGSKYKNYQYARDNMGIYLCIHPVHIGPDDPDQYRTGYDVMQFNRI